MLTDEQHQQSKCKISYGKTSTDTHAMVPVIKIKIPYGKTLVDIHAMVLIKM